MCLRSAIFKVCLFVGLLTSVATVQGNERDSLPRPALDRREHIGYTGWKRIVPTHVKAQYAGGMGVVSVGGGWDYGKKCRWESDLLIGYLPKRYSDDFHTTFTLKQNYIPWQVRLHDHLSIEPLTGSCYLNFISGEDYWMREPDRYGGAYYRFTTRLRLHLAVGQRATWHLHNPQGYLRSITLYYELHAYDLDIAAKCTNKSLNMSDIVHFSFGIKFQLMQQK